MNITITIEDTALLGGARVSVEPTLEVLDAAAGGHKLTNAAVYALGALNRLRAVNDSGAPINIPRPKLKARTILTSERVNKVVIKLDDRGDGGVACKASPPFSTLAAMVAGGSELTQVHKFSMVALARIYEMATKREAVQSLVP